MMHLYIDRQPTALDQSMQTWADLLSRLDAEMDARGRLLTEVEFDGVGEPTFRDPLVLERSLGSVTRIDATTATPGDLLRDCLLEAAGIVAGLTTEAVAVAERFRDTQPGDGHVRLAHIAQELGQLLVLVQTLQGPLGLVTAGAQEAPGAEREELDRLETLVGDLVAAQEAGDHQAVADALEYDLVPFLQAWQARFERLAG